MADCEHSQHWLLDDCPGLTEAELAFGEKIKTVDLNFSGAGGKETWHGPTCNERLEQMFSDAKKTGIKPEYVGRRWV